VDENILVESISNLVREPTDESRYETTWDQVIELIGSYLDETHKETQ